MLHIIDSIDKDNSRIVEFVTEEVESINIRLKLGAPVISEYVDGIMYYHRIQEKKEEPTDISNSKLFCKVNTSHGCRFITHKEIWELIKFLDKHDLMKFKIDSDFSSFRLEDLKSIIEKSRKTSSRKPFTNPTIFGIDYNDLKYAIILLENKGFIFKNKDDRIINFKRLEQRLDDAKLSVPIENSAEEYRVPMEQLAHTVSLFAKRGLLRKSPVDFDNHINFTALEEKLNQTRLVIENPSLSMHLSDKFLGISFDNWNKIFCTCYAQALLDSDGNINIDEICRRLKQG
jgi:hypothetical protein